MIYVKRDTLRCFLIIAVMALVIVLIALWCNDKQPIQNASMDELVAVNGIGEELAKEVYDYLRENTLAEVEDLIEIEGIGPVRLSELEECFR